MTRHKSLKNKRSIKKQIKTPCFGTIRKRNKNTTCCDICNSRFISNKIYYKKIPFTSNKKDKANKLCSCCNNQLIKFNTYKNKNASVEYGTILFNSRINGAGLGLYALKNYKKGEIITMYNGEIKDSLDNIKNKYYLIEIKKNKLIDGNPKLSTNKFDLLKLGAYANDLTFCDQINSNATNNAFFQSLYDMNISTVNLIANRDISILEEIYAYYKYEK